MADFKERLRLDTRWVYKLLAVLGCLPSESGEFNIFYMSASMGLIVFGFTLTVSTMYSVCPDNMEDCVYNVSPFLGSVLSVIKFGNFVVRRKKFFLLMKTIKEDFWYKNINGPAEEKEIILRYSRYLYLSTSAHVTGLVLAVPMWVLKAAVEMLMQALHSEPVVRTLPWKGWIPVSSDTSFGFMYVLQAMACFYCGFSMGLTDCVYFFYILHTCAQFKLIQVRLRNFDKTENGFECSIENQEKNIWKIIEHHQVILDFCDKIEDVEAIHLLSQFVIATLFLCCAGFIATMFPGNTFIYLQTIQCILMSATQTFLHCLPGTMLTTESLGVALAAYDSDWYNAPIHIQKQLMFIIARAQRPVILTPGKLIQVSLESFETIIRTAASYFTVLQSMQEDT